MDAPLPDLLAKGIVWISVARGKREYRSGVGKDALNASPRVGHLHIHVDDLPWLWAHMSSAPIDVALLPPGPHKIRIELVNAIHQNVPEQSKTVTFTIPDGARPH